MIGFWNISVYLTYLGLCSAVGGIFFAINEAFLPAVICLLFSGLCDTFDGRIARAIKRTEDEKKFGIQIDSLCDLVCFGVFPAVLCYQLGVRSIIGIAGLVLFVLFGQVRLAYYNVTEEKRQQEEEGKRKYYQGLPITNSCLLIPLVYAFHSNLSKDAFSILLTVAVYFMAFMYVLNIKIPKPGKKGTLALICLGVLALALIIINVI